MERIYKANEIVWKTKQYRVVFYLTFGFSLQKYSTLRGKWITISFAKDANAFDSYKAETC